MKKVIAVKRSRAKTIFLTVIAVLFVSFVILPLSLSALNGAKIGNVALIPIEGVITGNGGGSFGESYLSSKDIVEFIESADENSHVKVILLEINSPGGSAVASDEIATAVKNTKKPVVSLIREVGASGGYWVASATEHIVANRMSITGSIGVISSYLEFSGLMEKYGVGYEQLTAGANKDLGTPYKKLTTDKKDILQKKIDRIHDFFIEEVAKNRDLSEDKVRAVATGEFYLGIEAMNFGLIDELGNKKSVEEYIKKNYDLEEITYTKYQVSQGLFDIFSGVTSNFFFNIGEGVGSVLVRGSNQMMLI